jgi:citrate synthase
MTRPTTTSSPAPQTQASAPAAPSSGLDGIEIGTTELSLVDGAAGRLVYRGHDVEALARTAGFEDVCHLLWHGGLPDAAQRGQLTAALGAARLHAWKQLPRLEGALDHPDAMVALRSAASRIAPDAVPELASEAVITGAVGVLAAAWLRGRRGQPVPAPDPAARHAADLLRLAAADGAGPHAAAGAAAGLDAYLVTVADHGMNASTFTARVIASTGSDLVSAVVGAIGALKGPLHGGAPGPVLDMLDQIAATHAAAPEAWIAAALDRGERIMGMGHRIYRVRDPRAAVFEAALVQHWPASAASALEGAGARLALARAVERAAERVLAERKPDRPLKANVEFYTAVLLEAVGLPRELFTAVFAAGRVAGWCAHVAEQRRTGRLIRPSVRYVGPAPAAR